MATVKFSRKRAHQVYKTKDGYRRARWVSTVAKVGESQEFLLNWYYRLGTEGQDPKAVMAEAAGIGTVGHGMIQCSFNGDVGDFSEFSAKRDCWRTAKMYDKFRRVWSRTGHGTLCPLKLQLVSEKHGYGGNAGYRCPASKDWTAGLSGCQKFAKNLPVDDYTASWLRGALE